MGLSPALMERTVHTPGPATAAGSSGREHTPRAPAKPGPPAAPARPGRLGLTPAAVPVVRAAFQPSRFQQGGLLVPVGYLLLEDGRQFAGVTVSAGASRWVSRLQHGDDRVPGGPDRPSYAGQIVVMTYPLIGNYGVTPEDESPPCRGSPVSWCASSRRSARAGAPGFAGVVPGPSAWWADEWTRAVTRHVRQAGAMRAAIAPASVRRTRSWSGSGPPADGGPGLACAVDDGRYEVPAVGPERFRVVAYDLGVKSRSLRLLAERGCRVIVVPAGTPPEAVVELQPDGLFVSNGPGDPEAVEGTLETIRRLANAGTPVFGICLGHQLVAPSAGKRTSSLRAPGGTISEAARRRHGDHRAEPASRCGAVPATKWRARRRFG